jgi:hypothetical protein
MSRKEQSEISQPRSGWKTWLKHHHVPQGTSEIVCSHHNGEEKRLIPVQSSSDSDSGVSILAAEELYHLSPEDAQKAIACKLLPYWSPPATNAPVSK